MEVESKISQALRHIASFQLKRKAFEELQQYYGRYGEQAPSIVEAKFTGALDSGESSTVKSCVDFLYGLEVNEARMNYPLKSERELRMLGEKSTKVMVKGIVDREWKSLISQVKEEECPSQSAQALPPMEQPSYEARGMVREEQVFRTPPRVIRRVKQEYWYESQAVMSYPPLCCEMTTPRLHSHPHANSQESTSYTPRLPLRHHDQLPPGVSEERVILEQTQIKGHFLYGDEIDSILEVFAVHDQNFAQVTWKEREDGSRPHFSIMPLSYLQAHDPQRLFDFNEKLMARYMERRGLSSLEGGQ